MVLTEWEELRWLDFTKVRDLLAEPNVVDARNLLDPAAMRRIGLPLRGHGPPVTGTSLRRPRDGGWSSPEGRGSSARTCARPSWPGATGSWPWTTCRRGVADNVAALVGQPRLRARRGRRERDGSPSRAPSTPSCTSPARRRLRTTWPARSRRLAVGSEGTRHALALAAAHGARFILASTSEVYGDPVVHPQPETYWGNVNPVGPRSVYDEAKRFAEALTMATHRATGVDVGIVRIFNTYGPRLRPGDGRVVSNFLVQAIEGRPLTVYGDGSQTRSLCFVDDEVAGILALLDSALTGPVNIGNPDELTVLELAHAVLALTGSSSTIVYEPSAHRRPHPSSPRHHRGPARARVGAGGAPGGGPAPHGWNSSPRAPRKGPGVGHDGRCARGHDSEVAQTGHQVASNQSANQGGAVGERA